MPKELEGKEVFQVICPQHQKIEVALLFKGTGHVS